MRRTVIAAAVAAALALVGTAAQAGDRWQRGHGYGHGYGHGGPPPWAHGGGKGWKHRGGDWYGGPRYVIVEPRRRWHAPPPPPRWPPPGITVTIPFPYR
jgi:hypothetical protein